jgi:hypothetical protein
MRPVIWLILKNGDRLEACPTLIFGETTEVRRLPIIFAQEKPENEQAQEFGDVQDAPGGGKTRAGGAVF